MRASGSVVRGCFTATRFRQVRGMLCGFLPSSSLLHVSAPRSCTVCDRGYRLPRAASVRNASLHTSSSSANGCDVHCREPVVRDARRPHSHADRIPALSGHSASCGSSRRRLPACRPTRCAAPRASRELSSVGRGPGPASLTRAEIKALHSWDRRQERKIRFLSCPVTKATGPNVYGTLTRYGVSSSTGW